MAAYLKIENPGVAPPEAFTLLGATTKRGAGQRTIGKFGSGNKHGVAVLLRHDLAPVVFTGNLKLEFGTRPQGMNDGFREHTFARVVVKYGGKDAGGVSRSSTEDLGFVLEYGATDWLTVDLALREFVSNAIDRAIEEGEVAYLEGWVRDQGADFVEAVQAGESWAKAQTREALDAYRKTARDYKDVVVEVVNENQVRAKAGTTRVFVPLNEAVLSFYNNLGKWFLHFSEPELLDKTILPKKGRNLGDRRTAVIYRRGVRVREFESKDTPSLFDYNLENLELDESRKVDDWRVQYEAGRALAAADLDTVARFMQSFSDGVHYWEHDFNEYALSGYGSDKVWQDAFVKVHGEDAVIAHKDGGGVAARKGYTVVTAPDAVVTAAEKYGIRTPAKVLTQDDREGREIIDPLPDADAAVDFVWDLAQKHGMTAGKSRPPVKCFRKIMDAGAQTLGFYRDGVVYLNEDICGSGSLTQGWHVLTQQLLVTALEEVAHYVTGATDNSRDFQDWCLNLAVKLGRKQAGLD